ncbi:MAG TPA: hypothetical protein VG122_25075 [Gemmata sp.]|nr:hypothetical protein [Gemmata sp.]
MRHKHALITAACLVAGLALAPAARTQTQDDGLQPYYWPNRTVGIPVDVDRIAKLPNRPSDLQLYYAINHGPFQKGAKVSLNNMQQFDNGKRGFLFTSDRDGDFEFSVQFIYPDGSSSPPVDSLSPQQRVVIDTTPPVIRLVPTNNGVEWNVTDDNLDPRSITLKCKWPSSRDWMVVTDRTVTNGRPLRPADRYAWQLDPGKVLEVRLEAEDRAGHKSISQTVRVPPDGASGAGLTRPGGGSSPNWVGTTANLPAPRVEFVNTLKFDVDYTIQRMGRSGIQAAHLFVLRNQGNWELVKRYPVKLMPSDKDQTLSLPYEATSEGSYGFYVIPESGAGKKADDPKRDDSPLVWVVVDTTPPYVKITGVQVKPGTSRGPLVEITWEVADPNLMPQPVSLEWSPDKTATKWNEIKYRLDNLPGGNTGRYTWEIPDENLWKFWIRARAVDKAANTGESIWPQEVIVDLEQPSAGIVKVRGGNSPVPAPGTQQPKNSGGSDLPPSVPVVPTVPVPPSQLP